MTLTIPEVARRLRVGKDKVRKWVLSGLLRAVNTSDATRPRYVITPESLADFEGTRSATTPKKSSRGRLPKVKNYYADSKSHARTYCTTACRRRSLMRSR